MTAGALRGCLLRIQGVEISMNKQKQPGKKRRINRRLLFVRIVAGAVALLMIGSVALSALFL